MNLTQNKFELEQNLSQLSKFGPLESIVGSFQNISIQDRERDLMKYNNVFDSLSCNEEFEESNQNFIISINGEFKKIWDFIIFFWISAHSKKH